MLKDPGQNNVQELIKKGTCKPKREAAKLARGLNALCPRHELRRRQC